MNVAFKILPWVTTAGLAVSLYLSMQNTTKEKELRVTQVAAERLAHSVTKTSVSALQGIVAQYGREADNRAKQYEDSVARMARASAENQTRYSATSTHIASLLAGRGGPRDTDCLTPVDVRGAGL